MTEAQRIEREVEVLNRTIDSLLAVRHLVALGQRPSVSILNDAKDTLLDSLVMVRTI